MFSLTGSSLRCCLCTWSELAIPILCTCALHSVDLSAVLKQHDWDWDQQRLSSSVLVGPVAYGCVQSSPLYFNSPRTGLVSTSQHIYSKAAYFVIFHFTLSCIKSFTISVNKLTFTGWQWERQAEHYYHKQGVATSMKMIWMCSRDKTRHDQWQRQEDKTFDQNYRWWYKTGQESNHGKARSPEDICPKPRTTVQESNTRRVTQDGRHKTIDKDTRRATQDRSRNQEHEDQNRCTKLTTNHQLVTLSQITVTFQALQRDTESSVNQGKMGYKKHEGGEETSVNPLRISMVNFIGMESHGIRVSMHHALTWIWQVWTLAMIQITTSKLLTGLFEPFTMLHSHSSWVWRERANRRKWCTSICRRGRCWQLRLNDHSAIQRGGLVGDVLHQKTDCYSCYILFILLAISGPPANSAFSRHKLQSVLAQNATLDLQTSITFLLFSLCFSLSISVLVLALYIAPIQCQAVCITLASKYPVRSPSI